MDTPELRVGFVGTGNIGKPMAVRLIEAGFPTTVFARRPEVRAELQALGARIVDTAREMAEAAEVVIAMVRDASQTEQVLAGEDGILAGLRPGGTLVVMSTVQPRYVRDLAARLAEQGIGVLDAPVSGGKRGAAAGTLTIVVGGDEAVLARCLPVIEALGKHIHHVGPPGSGECYKVLNNALTMMHFATATEVVAIARQAGLDVDRLIEIVQQSSGDSWVTRNWDFVVSHALPRFRTETTHPSAGLMYKDARLALDLALDVGVFAPVLALCSQIDITGGDDPGR